MNKTLPSYIYFIYEYVESQMHLPVKIGETYYPHQRIVQLQTGNYRPLRYYKLLACPNKVDAQKIEEFLHEFYSDYRLRGEWFNLTMKEIDKVADTIEILIRDQLSLDIFHDIYATKRNT
jgi:hypothetical protein